MNIIILQHIAVETPGVFLDFFREDGFRWTTVQLDEGQTVPELDPFDLMVVMGGPQDVWQEDQYPWFREEKAVIRKFVIEMRRPYLGFCLGHQLLADATGGTVGLAKSPEVGVLTVSSTEAGRRDRVLRDLPDPMTVLQWHGAEVTGLPGDAEVLAESDVCGIQACRVGKHAYGFQCHVEITDETVRQWAVIPEYASSLESALGKGAVAQLQAEVSQRLPQFNKDAHTLYEGFKAAIKGQRG
ncbi:MAG TPA: type 1 glutamine amidotransferase [Methyloceanibacter sp.]